MKRKIILVAILMLAMTGCRNNKDDDSANAPSDLPQTEITGMAPVDTNTASNSDANANGTSQGENNDPSEKEYVIDIQELADELKNDIAFGDEMIEGADIVISRQYKIDESAFVSQASYFSMAVTTEEIAVIECCDRDAALEMEKVMRQRIESQKTVFKDYAPDEVKRLENAVVEVLGKYAIFCVSNEPDKVNEIIGKYK